MNKNNIQLLITLLAFLTVTPIQSEWVWVGHRRVWREPEIIITDPEDVVVEEILDDTLYYDDWGRYGHHHHHHGRDHSGHHSGGHGHGGSGKKH